MGPDGKGQEVDRWKGKRNEIREMKNGTGQDGTENKTERERKEGKLREKKGRDGKGNGK